MNRLNKKCCIASTGVHLLVGLVAFVGPAFTSSDNTVEEKTHIISLVLPPDESDEPDPGGQSEAAVSPDTRRSAVVPDPMEPAESAPPELVREPSFRSQKQPAPRKLPRVSTDVTFRNKPPLSPSPDRGKSMRSEASTLPDAFFEAGNRVRKGGSAPTIIEPSPGRFDGGAPNSSYSDLVRAVYDRAWILPADVSARAAAVTVRVIIRRDGTVRSTEFITSSSDARFDASIQNVLKQVSTIGQPFPEWDEARERPYVLRFDLQVRRGGI
jgi:outer membrane biosynthesis protein TonB